MKFLITGGAGFLGSHLCESLLEQGHEVIAVDNFFTGSKTNLVNFRDNPNFELIRHDITFPLYVEVDAIYNFASPASPRWYQKDPVQTLKTCVIGSINMLGLAKRLKVPILQASTSEVYGDPEVSPQVEEYFGNVNTIGPRSCYDEGKRAAETAFSDYRRMHSVDTKIVRIFNTYGPRMAPSDGRVVSTFIRQALRGDDLTIHGDGAQTRSFCYVDDLISGITQLMERDLGLGPYNLGNPEEISVLQLAKTIVRMTGSSSRVVQLPLPENDPKRRKPDISRVQDDVGWEPTITLEAGLERTIDYFSRTFG